MKIGKNYGKKAKMGVEKRRVVRGGKLIFRGGRGLYIGKYPSPGGEYQLMSFGGKNMKRPREKGDKCRKKGRKGKEKGRKGKENLKRGSKRVK
jgi:hypothetical protein